ncbi:Hypothetical predicted protein [Podarcis lilfordi]|uniref:Uncharacterized protein n=1 Tax=Podarcis lilfordi TaxID=74358 RepID=A0AA35PJN9_9SAUR|nr:Hypothetical predicted protein [Podarcis lilfordi]
MAGQEGGPEKRQREEERGKRSRQAPERSFLPSFLPRGPAAALSPSLASQERPRQAWRVTWEKQLTAEVTCEISEERGRQLS